MAAGAYTKATKPKATDEVESGAEAATAGEDDAEILSNEDIQHLIRAEVEDAKDYQQQVLAPFRAEATKRYRGDEYGDEEEGRSRVVSMDFRDTVKAMMPSFVRIFLGSERPVEFMPRGPGDEEIAAERTEYISYVAKHDNPGFRILHGAFKDALIRNYSIIKYWWDDRKVVTNETYTGLTAGQVRELSQDPEITDISYEQEGLKPGEEQPDNLPDEQLEGDTAGQPALDEVQSPPADAAPAGPPQPPAPGGTTPPEAAPAPPVDQKLFTVRVRREQTDGRACYRTVPGEEFFVSRNATEPGDAGIISHIRDVTRSDLVAMGYTKEFIEEHEGSGAFTFRLNEEFITRRPEIQDRRYTEFNDNLKTTLYGEHLIRLDRDDDGIAELCMVCTIGDTFFVAKVEDAPEINYVILCPDPEPNELFGDGLYKSTADIARIKTAVLRASLDSLRASIDPTTVVLEGGVVTIDEVMAHEIGRVIRETTPGAVRTLTTEFVGQHGLTMLDYLDGVKEQRTGITKGSQGLNADAMQSTTAMAVAAQFSASQQRIEMVARVFAEGIKELYEGLQRLVMRNQNIKRTIRLRGKWTEVDPRSLNAPMDVIVNVGLGNGMPQERMAALEKIYGVQKEFLQTIGPSPMVGFKNLRYTLARGVELGGWNDASAFFGDIPEGWTPPAPPEKPDPAMLLAKAQADDIQARLKIEADKVKEARLEMILRTETDRMRIEADFRAKIFAAQLKAGQQATDAQIEAALEHMRISTDAVIAAHETETDHSARVDEANIAAQAAQTQQTQPQGGESA
jgi:hypothetical protein